ncbi:hypothetical protein M9H77_16309 [Catharanthus roseus]|uniref:Uncharacterized protein n=1 Tax=Catharanthus roseus TaxID=4058 RepID=A0ACC0B1F2_CATRO|nr:hypothetical protein M9H77_16309 [Catharanthus roseus]
MAATADLTEVYDRSNSNNKKGKKTETGNEKEMSLEISLSIRSRVDLTPSGSRTVALTTVALIPLKRNLFTITKPYLLLQIRIKEVRSEKLNLFYYRRFLRLQCLPSFDPSNQ